MVVPLHQLRSLRATQLLQLLLMEQQYILNSRNKTAKPNKIQWLTLMTGMQKMLVIQSVEMITGMDTGMEVDVEHLEVVGEIVEVEIIRMETEQATEEMADLEDLSVEIEIMAGVNTHLEEVAGVGEAQVRGMKEEVVVKIDPLQEAIEVKITEETKGQVQGDVERVAEEGQPAIILSQMDLRNKKSNNKDITKQNGGPTYVRSQY